MLLGYSWVSISDGSQSLDLQAVNLWIFNMMLLSKKVLWRRICILPMQAERMMIESLFLRHFLGGHNIY